jgi:hypothetical protein
MAASAPARGLSGAAKAAIAIIIVAVVVVGVLAAGLVPGVSLLPKSKGSPSTSVSSSTAIGDADQAASAHDAGSLLLAVGVSTTYSFQFGNLTGNTDCPVTHHLSANFTVPAESGGYASGDATLWLFVYENTVGVNESIIAVVGPLTYFLGTISGAACVSLASLTPLPSTFVSSTSIAATIRSDAGSFLLAHATANSVFAVVENGTAGPEWLVAFTNCSYDPVTEKALGGTKGDLFLSTANGTSGEVTGFDDLVGQANCSALTNTSSLSLGYALDMAPYTNSTSGSSYYDDLVLVSSAGLTTAMFGLQVVNVTGVPQLPAIVPAACDYGVTQGSCLNGTGWYAVLLNATGKVIGTYGSLGWGDLAPSTTNVTLTASMELVIVSNIVYAGNGYTLSAFGTGPSLVTGSTVL